MPVTRINIRVKQKKIGVKFKLTKHRKRGVIGLFIKVVPDSYSDVFLFVGELLLNFDWLVHLFNV